MSKNEIAIKIQEKHQLKAEALLKNSSYVKAIKEYEEIKRQREVAEKQNNKKRGNKLFLEEVRKANKICSEFFIYFPYPLDELKAIAEGKTFFMGELEEVDIIESKPDQEEFLHFKIRAGAKRYTIHYLLDLLLDTYETKNKKERFRIGYVNPYEVWYKESIEGRNLLQIAKELSGINIKGENPAYNREVKTKYEQVKRASKTAKKITSKK
jgi:hypothetical protein